MLQFIAACFLSAFVVAWCTTRLMCALAPRWGLIDQPAARKVHVTATPLGGGIGIVLGVFVPLGGIQILAIILQQVEPVPAWLPSFIVDHLEGVQERSGQMWIILAGGLLLAVMGFLDDMSSLPWQPRLLVQFLVASGLVSAGIHVTVFSPYPWVGYIISVCWIVALINSFNLLDNMNGLSGGVAAIISLLFAVLMLTSMSEPHWLVGGVMLVMAGSLIGFLCHNWQGKIFMGDSGSYFVGLMMASTTMLGTFYEGDMGSRHVILAPLCILAVPLYDTFSVILIRLQQGRSPFQPDKSHFSHRLVDMGMSHRNAVLTVYLTTLTTGLGALLLYHIDNWPSAWLVIALICSVLAVIAILESVGRRNIEE